MKQGHPLSALAGGIARIPGRLASWLRPAGSWSAKRLTIVVSTVVVLAAIGVAAGLLSSSGGSPAAASKPPRTTVRPTTTTRRPPKKHVRPIVHRKPAPPTCPLTGLPPPHHHVPDRMLLAVKVGNNPTARPQSGLEDADMVFDTLAEGGITRYIAVYQCNSAPKVGPIRSVRWDDWHVLWEFGRAALSFVGGVIPNQNTVASLHWICDLNDFLRPNLYYQDPSRVRPDATYSSTAALWSGCGSSKPPPSPFLFSRAVQHGTSPAAQVEINFSPYADVVWQWSASKHQYLHGFREGGVVVPDISRDNIRIKASNVLILVAGVEYGPYSETPGATGDVETLTQGRGPAYLLRDGRLVRGMWLHPSWPARMTFVGPGGKQFAFSPGDTWVELVPKNVPITFTR
jgi:hypothetical protein